MDQSFAHLLLGSVQLGDEPGVIGIQPGEYFYPAHHLSAAGRIKASLEQRDNGGTALHQAMCDQFGHLTVGIAQTVHHRGKHPVVPERGRMAVHGAAQHLKPAGAGGAQRGQQRLQLAVPQRNVLPAAHRQRGGFPIQTGNGLGVEHRIDEGQGIQQQRGARFGRRLQQLFHPGVYSGKNRAGRRERCQLLRRAAEPEVLREQVGSRENGMFEPFLHGINRLKIHSFPPFSQYCRRTI